MSKTKPWSSPLPTVKLEGATFPVRTIWCLGRNFAEHARELENPVEPEPLVFQKGLNALVPLEGELKLPRGKGVVHHECELVLAVARTASGVEIVGLGVGLDLTLRDLQNKLKREGKPWTLAKSFDGAAPLSPLLPIDAIPQREEVSFCLQVNEVLKQKGRAQEMLLPWWRVPTYLAKFTTLQTGDLIFTGTPAGVGPLRPGDSVKVLLNGKVLAEARMV